MNIKNIVIVYLCVLPYLARTQGMIAQVNPELAALGNSQAALESGVGALMGNPAGIATEKPQIMAASSFSGLGSGIQHYSLGFVKMFKNVGSGILLNRFGNDIYSESTAGLQISHNSGKYTFGGRFTWNQLQIKDILSLGYPTIDLGALSQISNNLALAMIIRNINNPRLFRESEYRDPLELESGLAIVADKVLILLNVSKELEDKTGVHMGLRYNLSEIMNLRMGVSNNPLKTHYGISLLLKEFQFDFGLVTKSAFGIQHVWSLGYLL